MNSGNRHQTRIRFAAALLALFLAGGSRIEAQQTIRLRPAPSNGYLKVFPQEIGVDMDRDPAAAGDPASHWILEPIEATDQFWIRHVGTGQYLSLGPNGVQLSAARQDAWVLEPRPYSFPDGNVILYRIRNVGTGNYFSGTYPMEMRESSTITDWSRFEWDFVMPDGKHAPAEVAISSLGRAEIQRQQSLEVQRTEALRQAREGQGCWLETPAPGREGRWIILRLNADSLILGQLDFDAGSEREGGQGWYIARQHALRYENGGFTDGFGTTVNFRASRVASGLSGNRETWYYQVPLAADFPRMPYGAPPLGESECQQLMGERYN